MRLAKRTNGIWYAYFDRNRNRSLHTTDYNEARAAFAGIRREWLAGKLRLLDGTKRTTIAEFRKAYLKTREARADSTYRADKLTFDKIEEFFGKGTDLRRLTAEAIALWTSDIRKTLKATSANLHLRHLRAALAVAKEWGYLDEVPKVRFLVEEESAIRAVGFDEQKALFEAIDDAEFKRMVEVYLLTGMRRSELVRLTWGKVRAPFIRARGKRGKERLVPMTPRVAELLGEPGAPDAFVFPRWRTPDAVTRMFRFFADEAGLPDVRLHDLRHTTASMLVMGGADIHSVQAILGHSDLETTGRYVHAFAGQLERAMGAIEEAKRMGSNGQKAVRLVVKGAK